MTTPNPTPAQAAAAELSSTFEIMADGPHGASRTPDDSEIVAIIARHYAEHERRTIGALLCHAPPTPQDDKGGL